MSTFKYNDKKNIVNMYTEQNGRMTFVIPATRSKKSSVSSVLFQPFSLLEFEAEIRNRSTLHPIREAKMWYVFKSLPYDPFKSSIALFLSEFLLRTLREEGKNEPLYAYLVNSIQWLDECDSSFANFHLVFLMRLSRFIGLYPNVEDYHEGDFFDMMNACFVTSQPFHGMFLQRDESLKLHQLMRMKYETMHMFAMNRVERNRCLEIINEYYRLHVPDFPELKSLDVLKELFV